MFRKKAVERLSSPDQLDRRMEVVRAPAWLALGTFGCLVLIVLTWSILGRLPTTIAGRGVLTSPRSVRSFAAPAPGRVVSLPVHQGEPVAPGTLLAVIDQPETTERMTKMRESLELLNEQDREKDTLETAERRREAEQIEFEKGAADRERRDLEAQLDELQKMAGVLTQRVERRKTLEEERLLAKDSDDLLAAKQQDLQNRAQMAGLRGRLSQLQGRLNELETRQASLEVHKKEVTTARQKEIHDLEVRIALDERQLKDKSAILSPDSGKVVEISVNEGQLVAANERLGSIVVVKPSDSLVGLSFFPVGSGKKIRAGMKIQITPDTVQRERFGGIKGTVKGVSEIPVTHEGAAILVGSRELAAALVSEGPQIVVEADLEPDSSTTSGYKWSSSKGPQQTITYGTTTTSLVVLEERAPITYVLPFLRELVASD